MRVGAGLVRAVVAVSEAAALEPGIDQSRVDGDLEPRAAAGGERVDGERGDGERVDGERVDGERADGERADGEGRTVTAVEPDLVPELLQVSGREALARWDGPDLLGDPTTPVPAPPHGQYVSGLRSALARPVTVTGQPAVPVPVAWPVHGLPRGVEPTGRDGDDRLVAAAFDAAEPWVHRRPPVAGDVQGSAP